MLLDRDGVLNVDRPDSVTSVAQLRLLPGAAQGVALLNRKGYRVLVITNQSVVGRGLLSPADLHAIHTVIQTEVGAFGGHIDAFFVCPHDRHEGCACRKPQPGLLLEAAQQYGFHLAHTDFVGDAPTDIEAARRAGAEPVVVLTGKTKRPADLSVRYYHSLYDYAQCQPALITSEPAWQRKEAHSTMTIDHSTHAAVPEEFTASGLRTMQDRFDSHLRAIESLRTQLPLLQTVAHVLVQCLRRGSKVLWMGNGGSAADSQHLAAELVGRFVLERRGLASLALSTDTSILTAVGNDYGFEEIFARQIEALCQPGDVVIGLSTSGNSPNVLRALQRARQLGAVTVGLTGGSGGAMATQCDHCVIVAADSTARVQECHILIGHLLCEQVDAAYTAGLLSSETGATPGGAGV